jgi:hypothetical protein
MATTVYCMDSSSLIELHQRYPEAHFAGLWGKMSGLAKEARLVSVQEVYNEIAHYKDALYRWAKRQKANFKKIDAVQLSIVLEITKVFPSLVDQNKEIPDADPFIIALVLAKQRAGQIRMLQEEYFLVTEEIPTRNPNRVKIPDVCRHYGITCFGILEVIKREGWVFK